MAFGNMVGWVWEGGFGHLWAMGRKTSGGQLKVNFIKGRTVPIVHCEKGDPIPVRQVRGGF